MIEDNANLTKHSSNDIFTFIRNDISVLDGFAFALDNEKETTFRQKQILSRIKSVYRLSKELHKRTKND